MLDLQSELVAIKAQNDCEVLPELQRQEQLVQASQAEVAAGKRALDNDEQRILELSRLNENYQMECDEIRRVIVDKESSLKTFSQHESFSENLSLIEESTRTLEHEIEEVEVKKRHAGHEISLQRQRKDELNKVRAFDEDSLKKERNKLQEHRHVLDNNVKTLGEERVKQHSLASLRCEIEMNTDSVDASIKHDTNFLSSVDTRQVNAAKQSLAKIQKATERIKDLIPFMNSKLSDLRCQVSTIQTEKLVLERKQKDLQVKVDHALVTFLEQENVDERLQQQVDDTIKLVAEKECELDHWRAEEKKSVIVLGATKEKCSSIRRKIEQAELMQHKIEASVRVAKLLEIDLNKKCHDAAIRNKDLSTLCEMVQTEKSETAQAIQTSNESLMLLRQKTDELEVELRTLTIKRDSKIDALRLLHKEIEASSESRASNRRDKSIFWSSCRTLFQEIANEEARLEQFKAVLILSRKEVERIELQKKHIIDTKQSMADKLAAKKEQLLSLFASNNVYVETLKKGESICNQLKEEKKMVEMRVSPAHVGVD
jgi:chromosome segregation ATPase